MKTFLISDSQFEDNLIVANNPFEAVSLWLDFHDLNEPNFDQIHELPGTALGPARVLSWIDMRITGQVKAELESQ